MVPLITTCVTLGKLLCCNVSQEIGTSIIEFAVAGWSYEQKNRVENLILSLTNSKIKEAYFKELWYVEDDWKNNDEPKINFELAITEIVTV